MIKLLKNKVLILVATVMSFLWACQSPVDGYERHINLEKELWEVHQILPFEFNIDDTVTPYQYSLNFRYTDDYPYQDIFLFMQTTFPDGTISCDTLHADLFSPEGKPYGKGHRVKELVYPYSLLRFPQQGKYVMRYIQGMRIDSLQGMVSFGISVEKHPIM